MNAKHISSLVPSPHRIVLLRGLSHEQFIDTLASGFEHLGLIGLLHVADARTAAAQFAYLVAGEPLDRAMLVGTLPSPDHIETCAREGVETFLARYARKTRQTRLYRK